MSETEVFRRTVLKTGAVGIGTYGLAGCLGVGEAQEDNEPNLIERRVIEDARIPYLDLDTLESEFEGETLQAESLEGLRSGSTTYVGEAAGQPGLFIAVSHVEGDPNQTEEEEQLPEIVVYLCDGEIGTQGDISLWLTGEFNETGTTLTHEEVEGTEFKLALVDGEFLGVARLPDEEASIPFVTAEATGDAGLYQAETEVDEEEMTVRWIVLPDGRQRGGKEWPIIIR